MSQGLVIEYTLIGGRDVVPRTGVKSWQMYTGGLSEGSINADLMIRLLLSDRDQGDVTHPLEHSFVDYRFFVCLKNVLRIGLSVFLT